MSAPAIKAKIKPAASSGVVDVYIHGNSETSGSELHDYPPSKIIRLVQEGLPVHELDILQETLAVPMESLASRLGISKATLHRRKGEGRLDSAESDRVLRFARLLGRAVKLFGGVEGARGWLNSPQFGLGGAVPLDYAETEIGARQVEDLLGRIEYGVYS